MINNAEFVKSSKTIDQCPVTKLSEVAFIGRSNVGKSSLINALTERKALAKVSSMPGKTQLINHFLIDSAWHLVDLPGYGWAKVGQKMKEEWEINIKEYLLKRRELICVFVLIDIRHSPQKNDLAFMEWLGLNQVPFVMVFTKSDKISITKAKLHIANYHEKLLETWEELPKQFITSSENNQGVDELYKYILTLV